MTYTPRIQFEQITLGRAWAQILKENSGLHCPYGCAGCSVRWWGLVSHLIERHGKTERGARRIANRVLDGDK